MRSNRFGTLVALLAAVMLHGASARAEGNGIVLELARTLPLEHDAARWAAVFEPYIVYQPDDRHLLGVDVETGLVRWQYDAGEVPIRTILRKGDSVVVVAKDLAIVSLADGSVSWTFPLDCTASGACQLTPAHISASRVVLTGFNESPDSLMVVDLDTRGQTWPDWVKVGPIGALWADDRVIVVADPSGQSVSAVDLFMGRRYWTVKLPETPGVGGRPRMAWASDEGVHVYRAAPNQRTVIDTLALKAGTLLRSAFGAPCGADIRLCGVQAAGPAAVSWDMSRVARGGPGTVLIHDLATGATRMDEEAYFAAPPVTVAGSLLVLPRKSRGAAELEARLLPTGRIVWSRLLPDCKGELVVSEGTGVVSVVRPASGVVLGLGLTDGAVVSYGTLPLDGERVARVFSDDAGVLVSTSKRLAAFRKRPVDAVLEELRGALSSGKLARAEELDAVAVQLAGYLDQAAAAHALMVRHAFLAAAAAVARGGGRPEIERITGLLERSPASVLLPVLEAASGLNNLVSEWYLDNPSRLQGPAAESFGRLVAVWAERAGSVGPALGKAPPTARDVLSATGLQLAEVLAGAGRSADAGRVLGVLARLPLGLEGKALPLPARRAVAREAASIAEKAAAAARERRIDDAVALLESALALPFADAVIPADDPSRLHVQVLEGGEEKPRAAELVALAKDAARDWASLAAGTESVSEVECFESCQRRWVTCERPCVSRAACDQANTACAAACEKGGSPVWPRPTSTVPLEDAAYLRCL